MIWLFLVILRLSSCVDITYFHHYLEATSCSATRKDFTVELDPNNTVRELKEKLLERNRDYFDKRFEELSADDLILGTYDDCRKVVDNSLASQSPKYLLWIKKDDITYAARAAKEKLDASVEQAANLDESQVAPRRRLHIASLGHFYQTISVIVKQLHGESYTLEVSPDHTCGKLKEMLHDRYLKDVPVGIMSLHFCGKELDDNSLASQYPLRNESPIFLVVGPGSEGPCLVSDGDRAHTLAALPTKVRISVSYGRGIHSVTVGPDTTIGAMKQQLHEMFQDVPVDQMDLMQDGRILEDSHSISHCNLGNGSRVDLVNKKAIVDTPINDAPVKDVPVNDTCDQEQKIPQQSNVKVYKKEPCKLHIAFKIAICIVVVAIVAGSAYFYWRSRQKTELLNI